MGVTSNGHGFGCTFFFELPLYGAGHFDIAPPAPTLQQPPESSHLDEGSKYRLLDRVQDLYSDRHDDVPGSLNDVESPSPTAVLGHGGRSLCYYPFQVAAAVTNAIPHRHSPSCRPSSNTTWSGLFSGRGRLTYLSITVLSLHCCCCCVESALMLCCVPLCRTTLR